MHIYVPVTMRIGQHDSDQDKNCEWMQGPACPRVAMPMVAVVVATKTLPVLLLGLNTCQANSAH